MLKIDNIDIFGWEAVKGFEDYYLVSQKKDWFILFAVKSLV